ncbi:hypothetical protein R3P38DRAFT_1871079 [Favolaschia claudopus]|uniref:Uncharacterized protein n=1 Tax=Favolaschia claudopus TaxID=2862362 RepID=A0AAW0DAV4_9AGAR
MALEMEFARELTAGFGGLNADDENSSSDSSFVEGEVAAGVAEQEVDREPALGRNTSRRLSVQQRVVEPQPQEEKLVSREEEEREKPQEQGGGQLRPALIPRRTTSLSALREAAGVAEASSPRSPMRAAGTLPSPVRPMQGLPSPAGIGAAIALPLTFAPSGAGRAGRTPSSSRGGSVSRTHSRAPSEGGIPEVDEDEGEGEDEGFVASPVGEEAAYSNSHSSSSSYDFDVEVDDEEKKIQMEREMQKRQRRRFRKSSLVGDVLRFAPGSPNADAVVGALGSAAVVDGATQSNVGGAEEGQGLETVELELSGEDVEVMGGMGGEG